jgi:ribonuclease P protein component
LSVTFAVDYFMSQTLPKAERLRSRKTIAQLFSKGNAISAAPIRMVWIQAGNADNSVFQFGVSVPKKNFKRAVDRNRLKRQMREVVRKNKLLVKNILTEKNKPCAMMFVFTGKEKAEFKEIESQIVLILQRFISKIESQ